MGVWVVFRGGLCKRWSCESLGDQLGFGYGAILKGLVAWGGGEQWGCSLGRGSVAGWLVGGCLFVPVASPRHLVFDFLVEACFPFLFVTHLY